MSQKKPSPIIIHVSNRAAFSGQGSIIVLEFADENAAIKLAQKIARETGRCVTVRNAKVAVETFPAAETH